MDAQVFENSKSLLADKWTCNKCGMRFDVKPADATGGVPAERMRCPENGCGVRFWAGTRGSAANHIVTVGVWPDPRVA